MEAGYASVAVYPEVKHVCAMFDRYSRAHGKAPKLAKTPCTPGSPSLDTQLEKPLPQHRGGIPFFGWDSNVCESGKI